MTHRPTHLHAPMGNLVIYGISALLILMAGGERLLSQPVGLDRFRVGTEAFFEKNSGQYDPRALYLMKRENLNIWVTTETILFEIYKDEPVLYLPGSHQLSGEQWGTGLHQRLDPTHYVRSGHAVAMSFVDSRCDVQIAPASPLPGLLHYIRGDDPSAYVRNVQRYSQVVMRELYPGISAVLTSESGMPRYDFILAPGADPDQIRIRFDGADSVVLENNGTVAVHTIHGPIRHGRIIAYQIIEKDSVPVSCTFSESADGTIGFRVLDYDSTHTLVIDPLIYSTLLGTSAEDVISDMAVTAEGSIIVSGHTGSVNGSLSIHPGFPRTPGTFQGSGRTKHFDVFVTKFSPDDHSLEFSTIIGGGHSDYSAAIALDSAGNIYVAGTSFGSYIPFPTTEGAIRTEAYDTAFTSDSDGFILKLTPDGRDLVYSTLVGSRSWERIMDLAISRTGEAVIGGFGGRDSFPFEGEVLQDTSRRASVSFVAKVNVDGTEYIYSTLFGGDAECIIFGLAVDSLGRAFVTGKTDSDSTFAVTSGTLQTEPQGDDDGFISIINAGGTALDRSTLLSGLGDDQGYDITIDARGDVHVTGVSYRNAQHFPVTNREYWLDTLNNFGDNLFIVKIDSNLSDLTHSLIIGDGCGCTGTSIFVDKDFNTIVAGHARNDMFTTTNSFQDKNLGDKDAFILELDAFGERIIYATLLGGSRDDFGIAAAKDRLGNYVLAGYTLSFNHSSIFAPNFPTTEETLRSSFGDHHSQNGKSDAFYSVLDSTATPTVSAPYEYIRYPRQFRLR